MKYWSLIFIAMVLALPAQATDSADILPKGVRGAIFRYGQYENLNEYYTGTGQLKTISDINSVVLDPNLVASHAQEFNDLINALNASSAGLGNTLHPGVLKIDADPVVNFFAPAFAYGLRKDLMLGVAVPVIRFQNSAYVAHSGSNASQLADQVGGANAGVANGLADLDREVQQAVPNLLREKGYDQFSSRDETFIGDIQLFTFWQNVKRPEFQSTYQAYFILPTGPEPDADDLLDAESFAQPGIKMRWITARPVTKKLKFATTLSYLMQLPRQIEKRVPKDAEDFLPDISQKQSVTQDAGDVLGFGGAFTYSVYEDLKLGTGYMYEYKLEDQYSGVSGGGEKFLVDGTEKSAHILSLKATYSTVKAYFKKKAIAPMEFQYKLSNTFMGTNIENRTVHELTASLYF